MLIKAVFTHNPQDYFEGCEESDLSSEMITDADLPATIATRLEEGYICILDKISGKISVHYRNTRGIKSLLKILKLRR